MSIPLRIPAAGVEVNAFNLEPGTNITSYQYATPRFCRESRSGLGFRLVKQMRPDGSDVDRYFYQHHGRAGRTHKVVVSEAGSPLHEYTETWDLPPGPIPGSLDHPDVHVARLTSVSRYNLYGAAPGVAGSTLYRDLSYDDSYGFNFVSQVLETRPTGTLRIERTPTEDASKYIRGLVDREERFDAAVGGTSLGWKDFGYTKGRVSTLIESNHERGALLETSRTSFVDYDSSGNVSTVRRLEQQPDGSGMILQTHHCYDGDSYGWCPSVGGQDSHSLRVATMDPLGNVTTYLPDATHAVPEMIRSDYDDEPDILIELDAFGREIGRSAIPVGGTKFLQRSTVYNDYDGARPEA